jgi:hypothetical protein
MLIILVGRSLGLIETEYDADDGTKAKAYKLRLLQADSTVVDVRLSAKNADLLKLARDVKEMQPLTIECTLRDAEMKDGRYGRYLAKATYTFAEFLNVRPARAPAAA